MHMDTRSKDIRTVQTLFLATAKTNRIGERKTKCPSAGEQTDYGDVIQ